MNSFYKLNKVEKIGFGSFGKNVLISKFANFYNASNIHLGSNVRIDDFCILSAGQEGIFIDDYVHIGCYSSLIGQAKIQISKFANISTRVSIFSSSDDFSGESLTNPTTSDHFKKLENKAVNIEKHVIIGTNSTILPGVNLHEGCAIGAHSLVKLSCPKYKIFAGIPVKEIGKRSEKLKDLEVNFLKNNKYQ